MSFVDWNAAALPGQIAGQQNQNAAQQLDMVQRNRALNALHGVNLGDQGSVQNALNGLTQLGMVDQAKGLTDLAQTRAINQAKLPVAQNAFGEANDAITAQRAQDAQQSSEAPQGPAPQPSPDQLQQAQSTLQAAGQAISRVKAAPPEQRATILNQELQQFQVAGLDPKAIAAVQQHLSDANFSDESLDDLTNHYAEHAGNFGAMAGGGAPGENLSTHPTNGWNTGAATTPPVGYQNTQQLEASDPNIAQAQTDLNSPLRRPLVQGAITEATGIDQGPGFQQDIALTAPARAAAADAAFAGTHAYASTSATNIANFNTLPEVERAVAAARTQGASAGTLQDIKMSDGSIRQAVIDYDPQTGKPYMVPLNGGGPGGAAPAGGPQAGVTPTPARAVVNQAGGTQYAADMVTAGQSQQQVNALQQIIRLLPTTPIGPGTETVNQWRSFLHTQLPILDKIIPGTDERALQTADTNQLTKYMAQLATAASAQYGAPSDSRLAAAVTGNPHMTMDNLGALDVAKTMLALKRADMAAPYLFSTLKDPTGNPVDPGQYGGFKSNYARTVDPRAFELDMLTAPQRRAMLATITKPEDVDKFTRGVQAAEAAGYYHRADLPR